MFQNILKANPKREYKNIEMLRFLFMLSIIANHLNQGVTSIHTEIPIYKNFIEFTFWSWIPVDFFFVIAGFFMFLKSDFSKTFTSFAINKLKRFMPTILFVLLITYILSLLTPLEWLKYENLFTILNIQNLGLTLDNGNIPPSWFVSSLFWSMCFYFYLFKITKKETFNLITVCLTIACYAIFVRVPEYWNIINYHYFINMGMVRGLAGIGMGYILCLLYQNNSQKIKDFNPSYWLKILITILEIYIFKILFSYLCFYSFSYDNILYLVILFIFLFSLFIMKKGLLTQMLDNNFSVFLGKYTYSIFIVHYLIKDLWKNTYVKHMTLL
ncbi:acyltransferase [bacterium]|nr:acyltransferase [bacterium]